MRERERTKWEYFLCISLALLIAIVPFWDIKAISSEQFKILVGKKIPYYDVCTSGGASSGVVSTNPDNLPAETIAALEAADVKGKAEANLSAYQEAAKQYNIPWQALAAVHFREGGMDPGKSLTNGSPLGSGKNVDGVTVGTSLSEDAKIAAGILTGKSKDVYGVDLSSSKDIKDYANAFLGYNRGFMYKDAGETYDKSPYVMNGIDANHMNMKWIHADSWYNGKRINSVEGSVNQQLGALVIFIYLGGAESLTSSDSPSNNSDKKIEGNSVTIIGDSITVRAQNVFEEKLPGVDIRSKVSKHFANDVSENLGGDSGMTILQSLKNSGELRDYLVFALGTNDPGGINKEQVEKVVEIGGEDINIIFVTNYNKDDANAYDANNAIFREIESQHKNVKVADWESAAKADPAKFLDDNVHPTVPDGVELFVETIIGALGGLSQIQSDTCENSSDNALVVDGYAFPLIGATKSNYLNPGGAAGESVLSRIPCDGLCHHDYNAVDMGLRKKMVDGQEYTASDFGLSGADMMFYSTGVKVAAIHDGVITNYSTYSNSGVPSNWVSKCASVTFEGTDGKSYWLGHMSFDSTKRAGDEFKAGDVIGEVGPPPCAQSTQAHLHIDSDYWNRGKVNDEKSHFIIDITNKLYENLPEN